MKLKELFSVCDKDMLVTATMTNKFTNETKNVIVDKESLLLQTNYIHYFGDLTVKNIYSDCGLIIELKFDKPFWKLKELW